MYTRLSGISSAAVRTRRVPSISCFFASLVSPCGPVILTTGMDLILYSVLLYGTIFLPSAEVVYGPISFIQVHALSWIESVDRRFETGTSPTGEFLRLVYRRQCSHPSVIARLK